MKKHSELIVHTTNPENAEPPLELLRKHFITPEELFYVRNHGNIPLIDAESYRLKVSGLVEHELEISMDNIFCDFPEKTVMATVQCAGNRRTELLSVAPIPGEVPWREGAIGNATWKGIPLKEVLKKAGVKSEVRYVEFTGADDVFRNGENVGFGASIPIEKAMTDEVLLAFEMNGKPLEPIHGYPLRVIVPGFIGARSVKWLSEIILGTEASKNYFHDRAYRLFPPDAKPETVDWNSGVQLSQLNVNCVITSLVKNAAARDSQFIIQGYAMGMGGRKIKRVEVSMNGGEKWNTAKITEGDHFGVWSFWEIELEIPLGEQEIIARAFDEDSNSQPDQFEKVWNFKGYMNNAWHRLKFKVSEFPETSRLEKFGS